MATAHVRLEKEVGEQVGPSQEGNSVVPHKWNVAGDIYLVKIRMLDSLSFLAPTVEIALLKVVAVGIYKLYRFARRDIRSILDIIL